MQYDELFFAICDFIEGSITPNKNGIKSGAPVAKVINEFGHGGGRWMHIERLPLSEPYRGTILLRSKPYGDGGMAYYNYPDNEKIIRDLLTP